MEKKLIVPTNKEAVDKMKYEIENEFGVSLSGGYEIYPTGVLGELKKRLLPISHKKV